jgi:pimeloyl-ACP methyl ester carboxylesterase
MNDPASCEHACSRAAACAEEGRCLGEAEPISLATALRRFEGEAVHAICDTGRYRAPYFSWGQGPPLIFIHGLSDTCRSFVLPLALLSRHFRCLVYDLPTGRRDGARLRNGTHADLVADLVAVLDHAQIRQGYLFGSSFGSTITLAALKACPERFPRAVLQGGFAHRPLAPAECLLAWLARFWPGTMAALPFRTAIMRRNHSAPFVGRPTEVWDAFLAQSGASPISAVAYRALLMHRTDLRSILADIYQPILLVCGDRDPLVDRTYEEVLLKGLRNAGRVELPRCGHFPYYTHPELLAEVVRGFLTPRALAPIRAET